ncbi:hypothetical protein AB0B18_24240 [Micromonospora chalcea]
MIPDLVTLVTADDAGTVTLSSTELEKWWLDAAGDTYVGRQGLQVFLDVVKESGAGDDGQFSFRPSGWEVRLSRAAAQVLLTSAILGGVLTVVGADQLPAAVLAAAIPLLFDVQKVQLSGGERYLLARLGKVPGATGSTNTAEELYALLPDDVRTQTSLVDFMEFLDACHKAGHADVNADGTVLVHALADRKFRLTFL